MLDLASSGAPRFVVLCLSLAAIANVAACTSGRGGRAHDGGTGGRDGSAATCSPGVTSYCSATTSVACNADGSEAGRTDCALGGGVCVAGLGCRACVPNSGSCSGNDVLRCRADGSGYDTINTCNPSAGQTCNAYTQGCTSPCEEAAAHNSYIGCEYWPVPTLNNALIQDDGFGGTYWDFSFAIAIANPGTDAAVVTVRRGTTTVATRTIAGGALDTIPLDWVEGLQPLPNATTGITPSAFVARGAYQVTSTLPVTVYQFNPLDYATRSATTGTTVNSFSNDASLLLPAHTMTGNYMVVSRPTHQIQRIVTNQDDPFDTFTLDGSSPGFFTLVGVDSTPVTVDIAFTANVVASTDGSVRAFRRGETGTFTLAQGDVLQVATGAPSSCARTGAPDHTTQVVPDLFGDIYYDIDIYYCDVDQTYDLTGTEIRGTGRLELVAGHNCDFVPYNRWACDHLEEGIFPVETWGQEAIVSVTRPLRGEPNLVRIVSSHDGNALTFDPPSAHGPVTLNRGQFVEFEASSSFRVTGTDGFLAAQFLVGQDYGGFGATPDGAQGDPSFSLAIPTEQYRTEYVFLAPTSYASNFVTVTARSDTPVMLDGTTVTGMSPVGSTGYSVASVEVTGGVHRMTSGEAFGIVVYGFGSYTSYMYPGGLDLEQIDAPF